MEHEYRMKEIEIRNRDIGTDGDAETNPNTNDNSSSLRFERACTAFEVRQEHRSTQLARLLQGKALDLDIYQRLADDEVDDYDVLKAQLLKRFRLTEGDIGNGSRQVSLNRVKRQHNLLSD